MATTSPSFCKPWMVLTLSSGMTSAITRSMPTCRPIACAVRWLSPLSRTTLMPRDLSMAMASDASGLTVSATAMMPSSSCPIPASIAVLPSASSPASVASIVSTEMACCASMRRFPSQACWPSMAP